MYATPSRPGSAASVRHGPAPWEIVHPPNGSVGVGGKPGRGHPGVPMPVLAALKVLIAQVKKADGADATSTEVDLSGVVEKIGLLHDQFKGYLGVFQHRPADMVWPELLQTPGLVRGESVLKQLYAWKNKLLDVRGRLSRFVHSEKDGKAAAHSLLRHNALSAADFHSNAEVFRRVGEMCAPGSPGTLKNAREFAAVFPFFFEKHRALWDGCEAAIHAGKWVAFVLPFAPGGAFHGHFDASGSGHPWDLFANDPLEFKGFLRSFVSNLRKKAAAVSPPVAAHVGGSVAAQLVPMRF